MTSADKAVLLAKVQMPEKGLFTVCCPHTGYAKGQTVAVNLGYGLDLGTILETHIYDPAIHGPTLPGYRLIRAATAEDDRACTANLQIAAEMRQQFIDLARGQVPDIRILHARLSLERQRFFVWYTAPGRYDLASVAKELERRQKVKVFVRQLGARDEVAMTGAIGPCGRPCCCATWLSRYPVRAQQPDRQRTKESPGIQMQGICGRHKCCLEFEG